MKKTWALFGCLLAAVAQPALATILLNEVHLNPPADPNVTGDGNVEFIELKSTTGGVESCNGLTLVIVRNSGNNNLGKVEEALSLDGLSTGTNGLLLIGDEYTIAPLAGPWNQRVETSTGLGDPARPTNSIIYSGLGADNIGDDDGISIFLVTGWVGLSNAQLGANVDFPLGRVDVDKDGIVDWEQTASPPTRPALAIPWTDVIDSIGIGDLKINAAGNSATLKPSYVRASARFPLGLMPNQLRYAPDSFARLLNDDTPNDHSKWYGGEMVRTSPRLSTTYDTSRTFSFSAPNVLGSLVGSVTPGRPNRSTSILPGNFRLNEVCINTSGGGDDNFEFIEIINTKSLTDPSEGEASLDIVAGPPATAGGPDTIIPVEYTLVLVQSGINDNQGTEATPDIIPRGKIMNAWSLRGLSTGPNGLLLLGNGYPETSPWKKLISPSSFASDIRIPPNVNPAPPALPIFSAMSDEDIRGNSGFSLFLVTGYTGRVGQNLAQSGGTGPLLAEPPWISVVDSIGFDEIDEFTKLPVAGGESLVATAARVVGEYTPSVGTTQRYAPDFVARKVGNTTASNASSWYGGNLSSRSRYGLTANAGQNFGGFIGQITPGQLNQTAPSPSPTNIAINEILFQPNGTDENLEFVEIINPNLTHSALSNLSLIVINTATNARGLVRNIIDLKGQACGPNGLATFGDGMEEADLNPLNPLASPLTALDDPRFFLPSGAENTENAFNFGKNTLSPNSSFALLLVSGSTATFNQDLDTNDDGTLDIRPWSSILDGVSIGVSLDPEIPNLPYDFTPASAEKINHYARYPGQFTQKSSTAWYGGNMQINTLVDYSNKFVGNFKAGASPGRYNHAGTPVANSTLLLNEINVNPPSNDDNYEYIELRSMSTNTSGTTINDISMSLNGYSLLFFDTNGNDTGTIQSVINLDGYATGSNGLALLGAGYQSLATTPWTGTNVPDIKTSLFSPPNLVPGFIGNSNNNQSFCCFLVKNFSSLEGNDLDTDEAILFKGVRDFNEEVLPWTKVTDWIAYQYATTDEDNFPINLGSYYGPSLATAINLSDRNDVNFLTYTPDNISRLRNVTVSTADAWYGGDLDGIVPTGTSYTALERFSPAATPVNGRATPGRHNIPTAAFDQADADGDGLATLFEEATNTDPAAPNGQIIPQAGTVTVAGVTYPTFSYRRYTGTGTGDSSSGGGYAYGVQVSTSLATGQWSPWTPANGSVVVSTTAEPATGTEVVTIRPSTDLVTSLGPNQRVFYRLVVQRQ
jgi:hypothetical protein